MNTVTGKIVAVQRTRNSKEGNPSFDISVDTGHATVRLVTSADASLAHSISNSEYRTQSHIFHLDKHGKVTRAQAIPAEGGE